MCRLGDDRELMCAALDRLDRRLLELYAHILEVLVRTPRLGGRSVHINHPNAKGAHNRNGEA